MEEFLTRFNTTIDQWIAFLDHYSLEQLRCLPPAGGWSLGQVYVHLINDTGYFLDQMQTAAQDREHENEEMHNNAKRILEKDALPDMLIDGPATNTFIPQPANIEALREGLFSLRNKAISIVTKIGPSVPGGKSQHPGFLYFSAPEWLRFAEIHLRHHLRQKQRIDDALQMGIKSRL